MYRALGVGLLGLTVTAVAIGCGCSSSPSSARDAGGDGGGADADCIGDGDPFAVESLRERVSYLASGALAGRGPGTDGDRLARAAIEARFQCLGLMPGGDHGGYAQAFVDDSGHATANLIGFVPGSDVSVASDIVVVGAHHDHLGTDRGVVYPGANDNASGITALLAVAQAMATQPIKPRRTVAFVAFGAEESGYEGSDYYAGHAPSALPMDQVVYMVNLDMVGSYGAEQAVYALGSFADTPARTLLEQQAATHPTIEVSLGEAGEESDHLAFCGRGIPYLFFWTPGGSCYHESCDTADRVDYAHMSEIARLVAGVTRGLADSTADLAAARQGGGFTCSGD